MPSGLTSATDKHHEKYNSVSATPQKTRNGAKSSSLLRKHEGIHPMPLWAGQRTEERRPLQACAGRVASPMHAAAAHARNGRPVAAQLPPPAPTGLTGMLSNPWLPGSPPPPPGASGPPSGFCTEGTNALIRNGRPVGGPKQNEKMQAASLAMALWLQGGSPL